MLGMMSSDYVFKIQTRADGQSMLSFARYKVKVMNAPRRT